MSGATTPVVLACADMTSGYLGLPAVRNLSLEMRRGEIVALLGPNGAGKTTTLLSLAGVLRPMRGSVTVLGQPARGGRPHQVARRGVRLVPDNRAIFYGLTARENLRLAFGGRVGGRIDHVLDLFPALRPKLAIRAGLLSGGEQQMLAIGRAIAADAKVLLIDEMSMGLAPVITKSILPILRRAASDLGTAILLVEQHIDLALEVADRAYVLDHGELRLAGAAAELRSQRELVQASYLGSVGDADRSPDDPRSEQNTVMQ